MRYKATIDYDGTAYCGWQIQPNALSVQEVLQTQLSLILREKIEVVGCGRTDAGVHARNYVLHFETQNTLPNNFLYRFNQILPVDIAVQKVEICTDDFHARFDAVQRSYLYHMHARKDPFREGRSWLFGRLEELDLNEMQKACRVILESKEFAPFCKAHSDAKTMICKISTCEWVYDDELGCMEFHISANRFLRGMVRLIVGMMIHIGQGKLTVQALENAMAEQKQLPQSWSVPAHGLFFEGVEYK